MYWPIIKLIREGGIHQIFRYFMKMWSWTVKYDLHFTDSLGVKLVFRGWCLSNVPPTLRETNITMDIPPFVDVFPIGKGGFPASYVSLFPPKTWISPGHMSFAAVVQLCSDFSLARHLKIREIGWKNGVSEFLCLEKKILPQEEHETWYRKSIYNLQNIHHIISMIPFINVHLQQDFLVEILPPDGGATQFKVLLSLNSWNNSLKLEVLGGGHFSHLCLSILLLWTVLFFVMDLGWLELLGPQKIYGPSGRSTTT